jgi:hypothetical protein
MTMSSFADLIFKSVLIYVHDIIVNSDSFYQHLRDLEEVFKRVAQHNLTLKLSKCHFAAQQVDYLGRHFQRGDKPNPNKTAVIDTYPLPKDKTEVRRFVGMSNFYRRFIRNYSKLACPLNHMLKNDTKWEWSSECEKAYISRDQATVSQFAYPCVSGHE